MTASPDHQQTSAVSADPTARTIRPAGPTTTTRSERREVLDHQKAHFGGIKWGSAFFGWLTAVGTAVLLSGIAAAVGLGLGLSIPGGPERAVDELAQGPGATGTAGLVGAVAVAVVLLVAYYCGGYVAGRMARFNGAKQGIAVWVWAVVVAAAAAVVVATGGVRLDLAPIGLPVDPTALGTGGIIAAAAALVVALVGAVLGGLAGMRFHRRIDRGTLEVADLTEETPPTTWRASS